MMTGRQEDKKAGGQNDRKKKQDENEGVWLEWQCIAVAPTPGEILASNQRLFIII